MDFKRKIKISANNNIIHINDDNPANGKGTIICAAPNKFYTHSYANWKANAERIVKLWNENLEENK